MSERPVKGQADRLGGGGRGGRRAAWSLVLKDQRNQEIPSRADGAGNGGLIVFFEVEEETPLSSENSHSTIFRRVCGGETWDINELTSCLLQKTVHRKHQSGSINKQHLI